MADRSLTAAGTTVSVEPSTTAPSGDTVLTADGAAVEFDRQAGAYVDAGHPELARLSEAVAKFTAEGRSPLAIEEGVAYLAVHPESLEKNHCFQTAGSRNGDRRVPGLWISRRKPKLGYWAGNRPPLARCGVLRRTSRHLSLGGAPTAARGRAE